VVSNVWQALVGGGGGGGAQGEDSAHPAAAAGADVCHTFGREIDAADAAIGTLPMLADAWKVDDALTAVLGLMCRRDHHAGEAGQ